MLCLGSPSVNHSGFRRYVLKQEGLRVCKAHLNFICYFYFANGKDVIDKCMMQCVRELKSEGLE